MAYDRYEEWWGEISYRAKAIAQHKCCYPGCRRQSYQTHHAVYLERNRASILTPIKGWEIPGVHVFPVCQRHHSRDWKDGAHHPSNWIPGVIAPDYLDARNTPEYYLLLVKGWDEKTKQEQKLTKTIVDRPKQNTVLLKADSMNSNNC